MKSDIPTYSEPTDIENRLQALEQAVGEFVSAESYNVHDAPEDMDEPPFYMNDGETLEFSFKASIGSRDPVEPETDPVPQIQIAAGSRQIIGAAPASVAAQAFDLGAGGSVYMVWTYTTDSTPGSWKDFSGDPMAYGTAETEDETKRVVILATYASGVLTQRHLGDVAVMDIIDRTACS